MPSWADLPAALIEEAAAQAAGARRPAPGDETSLAGRDDTGRQNPVAAARVTHAEAVAAHPHLYTLTDAARLTPLEVELLALCCAVDLEPRLQHFVGELSGDPSRSTLDVGMVTGLLGPDAVVALSPGGRLASAALLDVSGAPTYAARRIAVPATVSRALVGDLALDPTLPLGAELVAVTAEGSARGFHRFVAVHGPDRVRRRQAAVRTLNTTTFLVTPPPVTDTEWRTVIRQATVLGAGIVLELDNELPALGRDWMERADHLSWAITSPAPLPLEALPVRGLVEIVAPPATVTADEWSAVFPHDPPPPRLPTAEQLHATLRVSFPDSNGGDLVRRVTTGSLLAHAKRVVPRATWDDLVLPDPQARQLGALLDRYRHRGTVHDEWGLSLYPSPGVVALFSGPSGTGKTTSAEVLAHELGVEMFRVDLSALVSKYIGETEKNLEQIFSAAHTGNYLLLFDEADSLFGSRSKVNDARDRYANLEVSYLLQRLETYDGFVVLTSNFQGNIDQAFLRRIHATVHFTLPSESERALIWERSLGKAPCEDLDLAFVAEKFDLSGGSIRNSALSAAFAAAAKDGPVTMVDVLRAVAGEMNKLGRRPHDAQFGPWLSEVLDR